jgi:putative peptide zinc metalloprotease protein
VRPARTAAAVGAAVALSLLPVQPASAGAGGDRTVTTRAVAMVRHDGAVRADADFDVRLAGRALSAATNTAVAYARCTDCRALAVSFQVVLVRRVPADLTLTNRALSVTDRCRRCEALSWSYQWVVVTGADRQLSPSGQWRLHLLGRRLRLLVWSKPPAAELARRVQGLAAQVQRVLATEIRSRPPPGPRIRSSRARR